MAVRRSTDQPLGALTAPAQPRHRGIRAGFINEDDFTRIEFGLAFPPSLSGLRHVVAQLFAGVKAFF
jgi:hypothetical protein